jgi:hypothetical protein
VVSFTLQPLYPQEAEWTPPPPDLVWALRKKVPPSAANRIPVFQSVTSHYTELLCLMNLIKLKVNKPVSIAERSKACTVYDRLNIEITGSNPARGMDVCLRVSVFCCPVFR